MEALLQIPIPVGGLSEAFAFGAQPPETAREFQNIRIQDCTNGRLRLSQRAGQTKFLTSALKLSGTKVQDLIGFFQDNRQVTYSAISSGSETVTWDEATPSAKDCKNVKTDRQGNVYALDGNSGIVKYSADGEKLWQLALPAKDTNHVVRALFVDEFDRIYAGVSEGGDQAKALLWCYEQLPDNKTEQLWEIETKAYIEDLLVSKDKLYTAQNRPDRKKSYVRVYDFIDETSPEQVQEWRVPHPVNSIAVKADSSVVVACMASTGDTTLYWRDRDPKYPESSPDSEDWTPSLLTDADRRIWAWLKGDEIDQTDVVTDIAEGVEIFRWRDSSKNLRHLQAPYDDAQEDTGPFLALDAYLEHKGLRFTQPGNVSAPQQPPFQALRSLPNASVAKTFADQQRTLLPGYTGSAWAAFFVFRPSSSDQSGSSTKPRWLFGQDRDNASSGSDDHIVFLNASSASGTTLPPTTSSGSLYWFTGEALVSGGSGTAGAIREGRFDQRQDSGSNPDSTTTNKGQICILTMVCDGQVSGLTHGSAIRLNGSPIDVFQSTDQATLRPTYLGIWRATQGSDTNPTSGVEGFMGDFLEVLVLDRRDRNSATDSVVSFDAIQYDSGNQDQSVNEVTLVEGYLAHKYGVEMNLPYGTQAANNYPHPFGITGSGSARLSGPPNQAGTGVSTAQAYANKSFACVVKYDAKGKIVWCANELELDSGSRTGGYGYAVAVNSAGNIYSLGPNPTISGGTQQVRLIVDQGSDFSIATADGAWSASFPSSANQDYAYPRIDVDAFDNLYIPYNDSGNAASFRVYKADGTVLHSKLLSASQQAYAVACDDRIPDYRSDLSATVKRCEHVFVGTENDGVAATATVHKVRLVSAAQSGASPRSLTTLGVSGGDVVKFTTAGVTTPTGGSGALDSSAYIQSTALFKKVYWTDGRQYRVYDPVANEVTEYKCTSAGAMPARCALIESWRGRIVLARSADEPHNWFLSKKDEPENFDFFPPVPTETDAVAGNNSPAGLCPDIINAVVPFSEDILLFGGDRSIWALVGDPAAGGRLELVSDSTGMAFGRPWCKDPNGVLYFFGSAGGLFRWTPAARPERVSVAKIERALQDIDLSTHYVRLVYNHQDEGLHILLLPFGAGGTQVSHYFFELKTESFAKDLFGTESVTNVQPTAACVIDGDEFDDRLVLFGGEDGFVRKWDRDALSDDVETDNTTSVPIDSLVTFGPLASESEAQSGLEMQFSGLTAVLGEEGDGCQFELFASESPDSIGLVKRRGSLVAGRNPPKWDRVSGPFAWLRLRNSAPEERFSVERVFIRVAPAGLARPRSF